MHLEVNNSASMIMTRLTFLLAVGCHVVEMAIFSSCCRNDNIFPLTAFGSYFSGCLLVQIYIYIFFERKERSTYNFSTKTAWFLTSSLLKRSFLFNAEQGKFR